MTEARVIQPFPTIASWEEWLAKHHGDSTGLWLKLAKKGSGIASINYAEALDVALCWGWIDGQKDKHDADWWIQRFCPRTARSGWSKINREKVAVLIKSGRMQPAGLKEVEKAKADGRWEAAYDSPATAMRAALAKNKKAASAFETLSGTNRYAILYRVQTAMKPETRAARIEKLVAMLARGETLHPQTARAPKPKGRVG